ncbi:MAG: TetR/AcrR family transcriptional regulator [Betaproteobacteria bacterium]
MPRRARPAPCYLAPGDAPAKKKILTEALRLFVRDGLCETSIRDIARATGYTNPALFRHFATKERLAVHLFEQCYLNLFQAIERAMSGQRDYAAKRHALIASYLEMLDADRDALLYVQDNLRHFWPMMPASVKRSSIVGQVQALLRLGRDEGAVTDAIPIEVLVTGWLGVLQQFARAWFFGDFAGSARRHGARLEQLLTRMTAA